mmetsp:Transcript_27699/g.26726  ORF Transcript_27699/g.26726 Transcript_27699/m.26726 type:complete len:102 (-) Transcript_27699:413-718(-)
MDSLYCLQSRDDNIQFVFYILQSIACIGVFFVAGKTQHTQLWRAFSLIYGINILVTLVCACFQNNGKYIVVYNKPEKYEPPAVIGGIILQVINIFKAMLSF